ncbi:hypothetical protein LO763_22375 [Glycomyces sp. A-F 0318]|uniref:hypothetical protein n=1 Tax=Glycomyces amatae TaxID=2881355 RepID=UPI001E428FA8|nr:hypothetical protein [Glycomyces amatae]MCD0446365.1 hypothetical protein [Glycomyces amatae]
MRLGHLPPWSFTADRREGTAALIEALDRDAFWERLGVGFPVHVGLLVKRGHLRPVGWRYGAPTFVPQHVDDLPGAVIKRAVMA